MLHSRFPVWRREELDKHWLDLLGKTGDRSRGAVLVATQVVEQSVDIDADLLITELAPTDMLLQRLGRLWRHDRKNRKGTERKAVILHPVFEKADDFETALGSNAFVYDPYVLWCSRHEWIGRRSVSIPDGIRALLEATYTEPGDGEEDCVRVLYDKSCKNRDKLRKLANAGTNTTLPSDDDRSCMTRYNTKKSLDILLLKGPGKKSNKSFSLCLASGETVVLESGYKKPKTAVALNRNILSITHRTEYDAWTRSGSKEQNLIQEYFFEPIVPLYVDTETGRLKTLTGEDTPLYYRDDLGVYREQVLRQSAKADDTNSEQEDAEENTDEFEW